MIALVVARPVTPTCATLVADYLVWLRVERGCSPHTLTAYAADWRHLLRFLGGDRPLAALTLADLRAWLAAQAHLAAETRDRRISAVKGALAWAVREGHLAANPAERLVRPRVPRHLPLPPSREDLARLLAVAGRRGWWPTRDAAVLELAYATGLRARELAGLAVGDLDLAARLVHVRDGKGARARRTCFGRPAQAAVEAYLAERGPALPGAPLWVSQRRPGLALTHTGLRDLLGRVAHAAGVTGRVWLHGLRHACATHLLEGGADLLDVAEQLGHTDLNTTRRYVHVAQVRLRRIYDRAHPRA